MKGRMRTIKITDDVWQALQQHAVPLEDEPNDVLRRWLQHLKIAPSPHLHKNLEGVVSIGRQSVSVEHGATVTTKMHNERESERGQQAGRVNRQRYIQDLRAEGIALQQETRTFFRTRNGNRVIILVANYELDEAGQWFLGVKEEWVTEKPNTFLILLCIDRDTRLDFVFPPKEAVGIIRQVRKVGDSLRFSVIRSSQSFHLRRLGGGTVDLTAYLKNHDELKTAAR